MRVLSRSSIDDGEDVKDVDDDHDHDDNKSDGNSDGDDNNESNNNDDRGIYDVEESQRVGAILLDPNYSLEGLMQGLGLTYDHDYRPQLDRSASTSTSFSTYHKDNFNNYFLPHRNFM